jgi:hypothetical protein
MKMISLVVVGAGLMILASFFSSCKHIEPSPIVTAFQHAGGGDVSNTARGSIAAFLSKHEELRRQLTPLCKQKQASAPAAWATTDEGKVCAANQNANFFGKPALKSDGVSF